MPLFMKRAGERGHAISFTHTPNLRNFPRAQAGQVELGCEPTIRVPIPNTPPEVLDLRGPPQGGPGRSIMGEGDLCWRVET